MDMQLLPVLEQDKTFGTWVTKQKRKYSNGKKVRHKLRSKPTDEQGAIMI
jgi:hypothetical protein